jgi:hypothetical protein
MVTGCSVSDSGLDCPEMGLTVFQCGRYGPIMEFKVSYPFSGTVSGIHIGDPIEQARSAGVEKGRADREGRMTEIEVGDMSRNGNDVC